MADVAVIMAGGSGTRFWPLSRRRRPKQLLALTPGGQPLLVETAERLRPLFPPDRLMVVCNQAYADITAAALEGLPAGAVLAEPVGRNTAPCVALAAALLARQDPDTVMAVLPADHHIADGEAFRSTLAAGLELARAHPVLVTFGVRPNAPHTGYGYIRQGDPFPPGQAQGACRVARFEEKPDRDRAERFLADGGYWWNSGMFVWRAELILSELDRHAPQVSGPVRAWVEAGGDPADPASLHRLFQALPAISIDHAVLEHSDRVVVLPGSFPWSDVGAWDALFDVLPAETGGVHLGPEPVLMDSRGCVVASEGPRVVCLGVEDLVVVATGDTVLVAHRARAQDVRRVVEELERRGLGDLL